MINSILYTNSELYKIGFKMDDLCSFCKAESETLYYVMYQCSFVTQFWNEFQDYWHQLSNQQIRLTLQDVLFGIITKPCPLLNLLNYFIIIGKLFLWDCRRTITKSLIILVYYFLTFYIHYLCCTSISNANSTLPNESNSQSPALILLLSSVNL